MKPEQLDEILIDGELISTCVDGSSRLIFLLDNSSSTEQERNALVKSLDSIWKALVGYQNKYPGSDYVKKAKEQTLNYAKLNLSDELYNKIYKE